eukprot:4726871-Pyramimonas_sp.AAC.1
MAASTAGSPPRLGPSLESEPCDAASTCQRLQLPTPSPGGCPPDPAAAASGGGGRPDEAAP